MPKVVVIGYSLFCSFFFVYFLFRFFRLWGCFSLFVVLLGFLQVFGGCFFLMFIIIIIIIIIIITYLLAYRQDSGYGRNYMKHTRGSFHKAILAFL